MRLPFYSLNKLGGIIKTYKDILPKLSNKNVIYKICCKDCNYVGTNVETIRWKFRNHNNINRKITTYSVTEIAI